MHVKTANNYDEADVIFDTKKTNAKPNQIFAF